MIVERIGSGRTSGVDFSLAAPPLRYRIEGPLTERREVDTPWGMAWAEEGTYVAELIDRGFPTGEFHVVHPQDLETQYRTLKED